MATYEALAVRDGFVVDCVFDTDPQAEFGDFYMSVADLARFWDFPFEYSERPGDPARVAYFQDTPDADLAARWLAYHEHEVV